MTTITTQFIDVDLNLPNHDDELLSAENAIYELKKQFKSHHFNRRINDNEFIIMYEETIRVLDYIGKLSIPAFEIEDKLEELYLKKYIDSPCLAKKLWLDHYDSIHHKYSLLKNRCFKILDDLDLLYQKINHKNPPNWNI